MMCINSKLEKFYESSKQILKIKTNTWRLKAWRSRRSYLNEIRSSLKLSRSRGVRTLGIVWRPFESSHLGSGELLTPREQRLRRLLKVLPCTENPQQQRVFKPNLSILPRLRNLDSD